MEDMPASFSRRQLLQYLAGGSLAGLAGCNQNSGTNTPTKLTETASPSPTQSGPTPQADNQAPRILSYEALPNDFGTVLAVSMEGKDDKGLRKASVIYGNQQFQKTPDEKKVTLEGEFEPDKNLDSPDSVAYLLRDAAGNETRKEAYPDQNAPELALKTSATENARELELLLEGRDDVGLQELAAMLNGEKARERNASNAKRADIDTTLTEEDVKAIQSFKVNTVTGTARDQYDNETKKTVEQYIRKYDVFENPRLDISAVYLPFIGSKFGRCISNVKPVVGKYEDPPPPSVVNKHIDQMQGYGIPILAFNFGEGKRDYRRWKSFAEADLSREIKIETHYVIIQAMRRDRNIDKDFEFIRNNILPRGNYETINGRPVLQFWGAGWISWEGKPKAKEVSREVKEKYGGYPDFMKHIRSELTINGKNPFIVGMFGNLGYYGIPEQHHTWMKEFDALTNGTGLHKPNTTMEWERVYESAKKNYKGFLQFAEKNDLEFIPTAYPGFNTKHNDCWGEDARTPRSPYHLRKMLNLADNYRTLNRIRITSFNEWAEGHQIEPGSFLGNNYGTDYLHVVEEFQQGGKSGSS